MQQEAKIKQYFEEHQTEKGLFSEYYSGVNMDMAGVKSFWLDLFQK